MTRRADGAVSDQPEWTLALETAVVVARAAGALLRQDFHRPGGPRGHIDKAEADTEAERLIRDRLLALFPGWGYLGEETGRQTGEAGAPIWLVDPNDGTRDYLVGRRGSTVSIALLYLQRPVLGVVFAHGYPDDAGALFSWAEDCGPARRNGRELRTVLPECLEATHSVLVAGGGDRDPEPNLAAAAPARYRAVPSIAHRLALVAGGEGALASSLQTPQSWDYAAGHALLRGVGGLWVDEEGQEVAYAVDGTSQIQRGFGGSAALAREMSRRAWRKPRRVETDVPVRLRRGEAVADAALLARAQGCLLGQLAGDALGTAVEGWSAAAIAAAHPDGPRRLFDDPRRQTLAGQPTDDSEMALALARSILAEEGYDPAAVLRTYQEWLASEPFSIGHTTLSALNGRLVAESQANGSLMRASPLGLFAHALAAPRAAELGRRDSALTHPHPVCGDAVAAYVVALAHAVSCGADGTGTHAAALEWARRTSAEASVIEALEAAREAPPRCEGEQQGFVLLTLQNAFFELLHAPSLEEGLVATVRRGGDTDTNAAVAGALLGAVHGRDALPGQWREMILGCRAHSLTGRPRPDVYWPTDAYELAERLLLAGSQTDR